MESASTVETTSPLEKGQRELPDDFETKVNLENQDEESEKMPMMVEIPYSDESVEEDGPIVYLCNLRPFPRPTHVKGSRQIFVGNLQSLVNNDIEELFKEAGEVVKVLLGTSPDGRFFGFAYVWFASSEEAEKALTFDGRSLLGCKIRLLTPRIKNN